jgi:hypothetical protein
VYTSTNRGSTWVRTELGDSNAPLTTVAISADGSRVYAAAQYYSIYTLQSTLPSPTLKLEVGPTNIDLSWPFPSTGFVLETSADLSARTWRRVAFPVCLNLSNLQNEVSISNPVPPTFYRLASYPPVASTFRDLDFESASIVPVYSSGTFQVIEFASGFPGWVGYVGTNQATEALFHNLALDSAALGLQTNSSFLGWDGKYYASIESGFGGISYLGQTGSVPSGVQSLTFRARGSRYIVSLNGQPLNVVSLGDDLYGANIIAFAGTTAELRFTVLTTPPPQPPINILYLDSIAFSNGPVP